MASVSRVGWFLPSDAPKRFLERRRNRFSAQRVINNWWCVRAGRNESLTNCPSTKYFGNSKTATRETHPSTRHRLSAGFVCGNWHASPRRRSEHRQDTRLTTLSQRNDNGGDTRKRIDLVALPSKWAGSVDRASTTARDRKETTLVSDRQKLKTSNDKHQ